MVDRITLRGIRAFGYHGVYPDEQRDGQEFVIDVVLSIDLSEAGRTDRLAATVHYGELGEAIVHRVTDERWNLIERLAERVAELVLENALVEAVEVTVHKPDAPIGVQVGDVSVTLFRTR